MSELVIMIACEADADARAAKGFAERVLANEIAWFEDLAVEARPKWRGFTADTTHLRWASIGDVYFEARLPAVLGFFEGQPQKVDASNALKALRLGERGAANAVVLLRDVDSSHERKEGLEQGRREYYRTTRSKNPVVAITGLANRYREAWLLAGFQPRNSREQTVLNDVCSTLDSVHPTKEAHRLNGAQGETRHAKTIWERLSDKDEARAEMCWSVTPLKELHLHGAGCGLSAYLEEVRVQVVPLLTPA